MLSPSATVQPLSNSESEIGNLKKLQRPVISSSSIFPWWIIKCHFWKHSIAKIMFAWFLKFWTQYHTNIFLIAGIRRVNQDCKCDWRHCFGHSFRGSAVIWLSNLYLKTKKQRLTEWSIVFFQMCSPAELRQQTEELCAVIDQVLQDPLTMVTHQYGRLTFSSFPVFFLFLVINKSVLCWK